MPIQYVGKPLRYAGKTLWEILGNLKNFGVGRVIVTNDIDEYPEISYYKILKVQPVQAPKEEHYIRRVMVWTEHVFRGKKYSEPYQLYSNTFFPRFRLVPKSEESKYLEAAPVERKSVIAPYREFPPLFKLLAEQNFRRQGSDMKLSYLKNVVTISEDTVTVLGKEGVQKDFKPSMFKLNVSVKDLKKEIETLSAKISEQKQTQ